MVAPHLRPGTATGAAIAAVFEAYAAERGKPRWGDKTPLYMQHLPLLERLFPDALFVHLVRDGRDAALSFLSLPTGIMTEGWGHPRDAAGFACQWATRCAPPGRSGRVSALPGTSRSATRASSPTLPPSCGACATSRLVFSEDMLAYVGRTDSARKEHQQRLGEAPRTGVRDWRTEMTPTDRAAFEHVAGDLLHELGHEVSSPGHDRAKLAVYSAKTSAWRAVGAATQRSPLWRRRHAILQKPGV